MKKTQKKHFFCVAGTIAGLWGITSVQSPFTADAEGRLQIIVTEAGLTVEAHGVNTEQALREIGAQVGFMVVAKDAAHPLLDVSLKDVPLETALHQLLRGENYAIIYRTPRGEKTSGEGKIGKVVLLSPSTVGTAAAGVEVQRQGQEPSQTSLQAAQDKPQTTEAQTAATVFSQGEWRSVAERVASDPEEPVTVSDLLATQAMQTVVGNMQAEALADSEASSAEDAPEAVNENAPPAIQLGEEEQMAVNEALLISTRAAQRNLATLVEGLATATDRLFEAQAGQNKNGNASGK